MCGKTSHLIFVVLIPAVLLMSTVNADEPNLVSWWKFDESGGDIAYDSAGNNDGTISGAQWASGHIDGALSFDGEDDYVDIGNNILDSYSDGTITAWVKLNNDADGDGILTANNDQDQYNSRNYFYISNIEQLVYYEESQTDGDECKVEAGETLNFDKWYFVAVSANSVNTCLYIDGNLASTSNCDYWFQQGAGDGSGTSKYFIGSLWYGTTPTLFLNGKIDDVRIYDSALSAGEIHQLYLDGLGYKALNPNPADGVVNIDPNIVLGWSSGRDAISHDVYFGTDYNDVNDANELSDEYRGNYDICSFDPCGLGFDTTYFWRIDELTDSNTYKGNIWSFKTWFDPNSCLVSRWRFDEVDGTIAYDSAGGSDGTVHGARWTSGKIGGALAFDGDGDYVEADSVYADGSTGMTWSVWLYYESDDGVVLDQRESNIGYWPIYIGKDDHSGDLRFYSSDTGDGNYFDTNLQKYRWYHVAMVLHGGNVICYVNGSVFDFKSDSQYDFGTKDLHFGARHNMIRYFTGIIDDVRIYDRALAGGQVEQIYQQGLVAYSAFAPSPDNKTINMEPDVVLSWSPGKDAVLHDVYFGTSYDDVNDAVAGFFAGDLHIDNHVDWYDLLLLNEQWLGEPCELGPSADFDGDGNVNMLDFAILANDWNRLCVYMGTQDYNSFDPCGLESGEIYYWRIDEVNGPNITKGKIWRFMTADFGSADNPSGWVDPWIDTGYDNTRWIFFSSACRPFGMVNLSPDTSVLGDWSAGYMYDESSIHWFSHLHAWQLGAVPVMPTTGPFQGTAGNGVYKSRYSHEKEVVSAGYHSVVLDDYDILVELTSTDRVGFHRYTFPQSAKGHILFDIEESCGPASMDNALARKVSNTEIEGYVINSPTHRRPKPCTIYFVAQFSEPFETFGGWIDQQVFEDINEISGEYCGAFVRYLTTENEVILMKVALSYVSIEQARLNLQNELNHWDFDRVRKESRKVWNDWLGKIEVEGGTEAQRIRFYTDLWHVLLGRRTVSDVDGKYCDMTGAKYTGSPGPEPVVRQIPLDANGKPKYKHFNSDSFWGSYWNINVIWALAYPDVMNQWCNFLVDMYNNGGLIPRGPSGGNYAFVMISAHSTPFIVSAYMKGIQDFDVETAYEGMRKNAFPYGLMSKAGYEHDTFIGGGIEYYIDRGYIPADINTTGIDANANHVSGAAQTLEYAYDDWCLAQLADVLGEANDYQLFIDRAHNYENLYDDAIDFMRPRMMDGSWMTPFEPLSREDWCESTAWQFTFWVPHDIQGLINLMGSRAVFNYNLNYAFERSEPDFVSAYNYVRYSNQPGCHVGHLFNYSGAPWLTQKWIRKVKEQAFSGISPYGAYHDDEDQGQLGGVSLLMAMGLFEVRGGAAQQPIYEITSPIFDKITIHLDNRYYPGDKFVIETHNNSTENMYIQSATLDGVPLNKCWFYHDQLVDGGNLVLELGPDPNVSWGSDPDDSPPSMTPVD